MLGKAFIPMITHLPSVTVDKQIIPDSIKLCVMVFMKNSSTEYSFILFTFPIKMIMLNIVLHLYG